MLTLRNFALFSALMSLCFAGAKPVSAQEKAASTKDTILFDFESGNFDGWTLTGDCWDAQPATAKTFVDRQGNPLVTGIVGKGYLTTLFKNAATTGKAVSKDFTIDKPFLTFRIGGGYYPKKACLNLIVDGKIVRTETGNDSAILLPAYWDVYALIGKIAHLEIVDATANPNRGYVMVDDLHLSAVPDTFLQKQLPAVAEKIRLKYEIPAFFVAVGYHEKIYGLYAGGKRRSDKDVPVTLNDKVMIGSITKSFTAIIAATLAARGTMPMNSTVGATLTDLYNVMKPEYRPATVTQLLLHKAGIGKDETIPWGLKAPAKEYRYAWVRNLLMASPLPIGEFHYSSGCEVVAAMCEHRTGQSYETLLSRLIFEPVGMTSGGMGKPYEAGYRAGRLDQPWGHYRKEQGIIPASIDYNTHTFSQASGGINCSISDLCRFGNVLSAAFHEENNPLGIAPLQILKKELGWGGDFSTNGSNTGDYTSLVIQTHGLVIAVGSMGFCMGRHPTCLEKTGWQPESYQTAGSLWHWP